MGDDNPEKENRPNMGDEALLRERVAEAIGVGGGVSAIAAKSGIPLGTLNKYISKTSTASFANAAKIAAAAGVDLDVIAFGTAPLAANPLHGVFDRLGRYADGRHGAIGDFIQLPFYQDVSASAGPGFAVQSEQPDSVIAFARRFLRDQGAAPEKCSVIRARGDSMAPTIPDASLLVVDHSQNEVANGCIMVINVGDDLLVKRVRRRLDGLVDLVSDNPAYPPETIGRDTIQQLRVVGRVVYFCRVP